MTGIFPRLNLRSRLLLLAVGVELIMLTLLVANSLRLFEAAMLEQTRWQVQQIMPVLSSALKVPVMQRDFATIKSVLDESRATEGIDYLVFVDQDGCRVAASGWADGIPLPAPSNLKDSSLDTFQRYDATLAIQHGGQQLGTLHMGIDQSKVISARRLLASQSIAIAFSELVLSALILLLIGYWLTRHLSSIAKASLQVAEGDFTPTSLHEDGDEIGHLGKAFNTMTRSISERLGELSRAKAAIETSEANFRTFFNTLDYFIFVIDLHGEIIHVNQTVINRLGYTENELIGMNVLQLHPPELRLEAQSIVDAMMSGHVDTCPLPLIGRDGTLIPVESRIVQGQWNGVPALFGIVKDVSELRESEERFSRAFNANPSLMSLSERNENTQEWHYVDVNESFLTVLGFKREDVIGRTADELGILTDSTVKEEMQRMLRENGRIREYEVRSVSRSGRQLHGLFSAEVIKLRHRDLLLCVVVDITRRVEVEQALVMTKEELTLKQAQLEAFNISLRQRVEQAVSELRQRDQMLISQSRQAAMGEMIGNIAHQWRQPLNALAMLITNLQLAWKDGQVNEQYINASSITANRLIQKMSATINDFRNFFSPDKEKVPFSALQQIGHAVELVEASFKNDNITITIHSDQDCTLFGFPNEYSQVLLNLFSNASEAITNSGVSPGIITVTLSGQNDMGCVTVRDNGGGIPEEIIDRIFEPYFSTKQMGSGIGLYMSKMIIERNMAGHITAHNMPGGCEFSVCAPLMEQKQ